MSGLSERATEQKCPEDEGQEIGNQGGAGSYHVGTPPLVPTSPLPLEPLTLTLLLFHFTPKFLSATTLFYFSTLVREF